MIYNIIIILLTINLLLNIYLIYLYKHNKFIIWEFNNNKSNDENNNNDIDYIIEPYNIKKNNLNFSTKKEIIQLNGIYRNKNTNSRIF